MNLMITLPLHSTRRNCGARYLVQSNFDLFDPPKSSTSLLEILLCDVPLEIRHPNHTLGSDVVRTQTTPPLPSPPSPPQRQINKNKNKIEFKAIRVSASLNSHVKRVGIQQQNDGKWKGRATHLAGLSSICGA